MHDLRDYIHLSRWQGKGYRRYKDNRTWRQRIERANAAWEPLMEELTDSYIAWKYKSYTPSPPHPEYEFSIDVVDIYTLNRSAIISRDAETSASKALLQAGYLGTSPEQPSLAVSLRTLELFYTLRLFKPNFSVEAFAKAICHQYSVPYRRGYRTALSDTFDIYLAIKRKIDARVTKELGHDTPNFRVLHSCPCCNYTLHDEVELEFSRLFAGDGNNSLKRIKGVSGRQVADCRVFKDSDYYLSEDFVNAFANEVKNEEDSDWEDVHRGSGDPTDSEFAPTLQQCTDNWKAAAADSAKKMWDAFHESGWYVSACRHGFILWVCDMIRSGELAKYPLAIVAKGLEVFDGHWLMGYDIGCSFETTIQNSSLGPKFKEKECRTCVNAFHGYSHNAACQQNSYRRRVFIDMFLQQWDRDKYQNLATMLHNNYVQALDILRNEEPTFRADLMALGLTEEDLDSYQASECKHLETLGTEIEGDIHAAAYVELLQEYRKVNAAYDDATRGFRLQTPADYQPLSAATQYNAAYSQGRKAETERRFLREKRDKLLFEVIQMETAMGINRRWEVTDREYIEGAELITTRKYRQALEHLHKLVVQRLFELHKMNLSNTGYKMRTHISHALQRRSNTIRSAVKAYNSAALALNPPRDTLDWSKVSHYAFLDQFNILSDTRHSVFEQPWARPVNRALMKQRRRIQHAREEITRCNVELRRLHTSIVDENKFFSRILHDLEGSLMHGPVSEYIDRRQSINQLLLMRIHQTYNLEGYTGERTPGIHINSSIFQSDSGNRLDEDLANGESSDEGDEGDDDEFTEGLGAVVDFMSNISLQ
ncbi:hypothetical protein F5880DRAFT_1626200 [Lentinula raphanica]|nr:hypothetical protein F5880DRAFT_1626200 [Lentinula raphanica]